MRIAPKPISRTAALAAGLALAACGKSGGIVGTSDKIGGTTKPQDTPPSGGLSDGTPASGPSINPSDAVKDNRILDIVMHIQVKVLFLTPCKGDLGIRLRVKFDPNADDKQLIEVPVDTLECMLYGPVGLKKILEGEGKPDKEPPKVDHNIVNEDNVIGFKLFATGLYDPPRPFLPAFISTKPQDLKQINLTKSITMTDWVENKTAPGTVSVRTLRYQPEVTATVNGQSRAFKETYDFEMRNDGFEGLNRISAFLFDRMMMRVSLKPFAVLRMELDTTINKMLSGAGKGDAGTVLGGLGGGGASGGTGGIAQIIAKQAGNLIQVHIEGDLKEMAGLAAPGDEDKSDDGVVTSKDGKDSKDN